MEHRADEVTAVMLVSLGSLRVKRSCVIWGRFPTNEISASVAFSRFCPCRRAAPAGFETALAHRELSRNDLLGKAAGMHEFVEHAVECAEPDRQVTLSLFQVRRSAGKPRCKPLAVGERHHEISASLPDHGRD
jgi:hypothetical protein